MVFGNPSLPTEVVSVENGFAAGTCSDPSYRLDNYYYGSTGGVLSDGTIIVCGGDSGMAFEDSCSSLDKDGTVTVVKTLERKSQSASVVFTREASPRGV